MKLRDLLPSQRDLNVWWVMLAIMAIVVGVVLWLSSPADAQQLDPLAPMQAYTTADPNNPDRLGLATPYGRFSISLGHGCDGIDIGQNLTIYPYYNIPPWLTIATPGTTDLLDTCQALVYGRMDSTPCFTNAEGDCDVALEQPED